jgi:CRP-like cAMP-binding protein
MEGGPARNPLVAKLLQFTLLSDEDIRLLQALCSKDERFKGNVDILVEGAAPRSAFVVTRGMACRYRLLPDGQRQILTFLVPGDFIDMHVLLLNSIDHFVGTIGRTRLAAIDRDTVIALVARHPRLKAAFWWSARQEDAMLRERIVALGRRSARGRVAYLLCELVWRLRAVGGSEKDAVRLPMTQTDLADALGLTPVYVNRILQAFRREQLITLEQRRLTLLDVEKLQGISGLNPDYLRLGILPSGLMHYFDPAGILPLEATAIAASSRLASSAKSPQARGPRVSPPMPSSPRSR